MFFRKTPSVFSALFPKIVWRIEESESVFLTFDDGPHPESTPEILKLLKEYKVKATFFILGEHVTLYPQLFQDIKNQGHTIGYHGMKHISGWQSNTQDYIINADSSKYRTSMFRPPYGHLKWAQYKSLLKQHKIVMWDLMPGDFHDRISPQTCLTNIQKNIRPGSIIALHDSPKAIKTLRSLLPKLFDYGQSHNICWDCISERQFDAETF